MSFGDPGVWVSGTLRLGTLAVRAREFFPDDEYESIGGRRAIDMEVRRRAAAVHGEILQPRAGLALIAIIATLAIGGAVVVGRLIERAASRDRLCAAIESAPSAVALSVIW